MKVLGPTPEGSTLDGLRERSVNRSATLRYVVEGVTGDPRARFTQAESAPGVPAYGDPFPGLEADGVVVLRKSARPVAGEPGTFEVLVSYDRPDSQFDGEGDEGAPPSADEAVIEISGATVEVDTNLDRAGNAVTVSYLPPGATTIVEQPVVVRVRKRVVRLRFTRTESLAPDALAEIYTGTVNADQVGRYRPGELFLEDITSQSSDGGRNYRTVYSLLYQRGGGFDPSAYYVDPRTGRPPADLVDGLGIITVDSYDALNFSALRLPWPS